MKESINIYQISLTNAIICGWYDTAVFLLERHPLGDINRPLDNVTLLYDACYAACMVDNPSDTAGGVDRVKFLLSRGADPSVPSLLGYEYPLHVSIALGNKQLIEELLRNLSHAQAESVFISRQSSNGWTALHFAITTERRLRERLEILESLLILAPKSVGLLEIMDHDGNTPVSLAEKIDGDMGDELVEALEMFRLEEKEN